MIKIIDNLTPEDLAMLQALYSRSPASVDAHLEKVERVGSGSFMDKFYVGYNHQSIGDCGTTTIFIEGVTMLAAKAIQDWPLYSGQEASTRYMDFSQAEFHNPLGTKLGAQIQEDWRAFYLHASEPVRVHLREKYPQRDGEAPSAYEGAISARAFDILRAFLPAGASTMLSWHTNLRQAADHLTELLWHPDPAVEALARELLTAIAAKYPHTFGRVLLEAERSEDDTDWERAVADDHHLRFNDLRECGLRTESSFGRTRAPVHAGRVALSSTIRSADLTPWDRSLVFRPRGRMIPRCLAELGHVCSEFMLDFGSFRDLQRHRAGVVRMPLLTLEHGFHDWYLDELPPTLVDEAVSLLDTQADRIDDLNADEYVNQSYIAMGYRVPCRVTQPLPAFVYRLELRSSKTVHPTLRAVVLAEIELFKARFPRVPLHVDTDPDSWTVRRGEQTITEKV